MEAHTPVLKEEIVKFFAPHKGERFIDATAGEGGHSLAIKAKGGEVLAIDICPRKDFIKQGNFKDLVQLAKGRYKAVLFDLGLSSWHLEKSGKGFAFQKEGERLDMRFGEEETTAREILNQSDRGELEKIFKEYGEEKSSKSIAGCVIKNRPLETTTDLNNCLKGVKIRARIYQALRIATNNELSNIRQGVEGAMRIADKVAVITYHSLEDRIIKNIFKNRILLRPSREEVLKNPRSRSAKLRLWIKEEKTTKK